MYFFYRRTSLDGAALRDFGFVWERLVTLLSVHLGEEGDGASAMEWADRHKVGNVGVLHKSYTEVTANCTLCDE